LTCCFLLYYKDNHNKQVLQTGTLPFKMYELYLTVKSSSFLSSSRP
jgi:hypothetical protein